MILKWQDHEGQWHYKGGVSDIDQVGFKDPSGVEPTDYGCSEIEEQGLPRNGSQPFILVLERVGGMKMYALHGSQGYLLNEATGSTIDTVWRS